MGIQNGNESIESIRDSMSNNSQLLIEIGVGNNEVMYPTIGTSNKAYGTLRVSKVNGTRIVFEFWWNGSAAYWYGTANASVWTGWKRVTVE